MGIYKRKILRQKKENTIWPRKKLRFQKKRKHAFVQEKNKIQEKQN